MLQKHDRDISLFGGVLENNQYGIQDGIRIRYLNLQNVTLKNNYIYGIFAYSSNISIANCVVTNHGYAAVRLLAHFSQTLSVRNSEIYDNTRGIYYHNNGGSNIIELESCVLARNSYVMDFYSNYLQVLHAILRRCILVENTRIIYVYGKRQSQLSLDVSECNISRTREYGFHIYLDQSKVNLSFSNNTFFRNIRTVLRIRKDFVDSSRSTIVIDKNVFVNNLLLSSDPLIDFAGKEIGTVFTDINENTFTENKCSFVIKVNIQSNREPGFFSFKNNILEDNEGVPSNSYSLGLLGCISNHFNIQHNVFDNELMEKELFVGRTCGSNYIYETFEIDATFNYWGTSSTDRPFHFANWNDRPRVKYLPAATTRNFTGVITSEVIPNQSQIGGVVSSSLYLSTTYSPYVVMNDLTVSENVTLTIEHGVELHFKPNIGLLVLGNIIARGTTNEKIKFCSFEHKCKYEQQMIRLVDGDRVYRGKLQILVGGRWLAACPYYFTSREGSVACRQLGYGRFNRWKRNYGNNVPLYKVYFNCHGNETSLSDCINETVSYCGNEYYGVYLECERVCRWGNIRIVPPKNVNSSDYYRQNEQSSLRNFIIHGAGYLHDQGVSSLQIIERSPTVTHFQIFESNGIEIIGQKHVMTLEHIYIEKSLEFPAIAILGNKGSISISRASISGGNQHGIAIAPIKNMTFFQPYLGQHDLCDPVQKVYVDMDDHSYVFLNQRSEIRNIICALEILSPNNTMIHFRLLSWVRSSYFVKIYQNGRSVYSGIYDWNTRDYLDKVKVISSNSLRIEAEISTLRGFLAEITVISKTGKKISSDGGMMLPHLCTNYF